MPKKTTQPDKNSTKNTKTAPKKAKSAKSEKPNIILDNDTFELVIPAQKVVEAHQQAVESARSKVKQDGFRKGKAPAELVKKTVGEQYLLEKTAELVLSPAYSDYIKKHNLQPLTEPDVKPISMNPKEDWKFEVTIALKPEIDIKGYEKEVAKIKKSSDLWKEKKAESKEEEHSAEKLRQDRLQALLQGLLEKFPVKVPELLLRRETEYQLRQLEHQLEHMGMTMQDFLDKSKKQIADIQQDYAARALGNLQVEMLLGAVVELENVDVSEQEVTAVLQAQMANYPQEKRPQITSRDIQYLHTTLLKQKALDHLLNL